MYLQQVQRGIDFVEAHLATDIALSDVALAAGLSQWHFQRIFKALTQETLKTYIRSRRFAKAQEQLLETRLGLLDIALAAGYDTQASFSRAFKSCFRVTPGQFRKGHNPGLFLQKMELDKHYLRHIQGNVARAPDMHQQPAMHMVGVAVRFLGSESQKNKLANKLPPLWGGFLPRLSEISHRVQGRCYGVLIPEAGVSTRLLYYAAVEVSHTAAAPHGMVAFDLPAAYYAHFAHIGPIAGMDHTVNYIYGNWLMGSAQRHSGAPDLEIYGPAYDGESPASLMHYAIPLAAPLPPESAP